MPVKYIKQSACIANKLTIPTKVTRMLASQLATCKFKQATNLATVDASNNKQCTYSDIRICTHTSI